MPFPLRFAWYLLPVLAFSLRFDIYAPLVNINGVPDMMDRATATYDATAVNVIEDAKGISPETVSDYQPLATGAFS
jgi:hypothetical protein